MSQPSVMDQFAQTKIMLTSPGQTEDRDKRTAFCNYMASEVENMEKTFRLLKTTVTFFSGIQSREKKRNIQFLAAPVALPHMCHRLISNSLCQRIHIDYSRKTDVRKQSHTTCSTDPSGAKWTKVQITTDYILNC